MKPLDFVKTPKGQIAIITETQDEGTSASIDFIGDGARREKTAWYDEDELEVIDNLPRVLADAMRHPFGSGHRDVKRVFGEPKQMEDE